MLEASRRVRLANHGRMGLFTALLSAASVVLSTAAASPQPAPSVTPPAPALRGVWPVQPATVVRGFEPPLEAWTAGHRGADLAGTIGAPVVASLAGIVAFAGVVAGRGVVVISHGDTRMTYEPVLAEVRRGDAVGAGDRIGTLDVTQSHCFPAACLHWGWLRGGEYLDPLQLVRTTGQVRLLPLTREGAPGDRPS